MNVNSLRRHRKALADARRKPQTASELEALARACGRRLRSGGNHPIWVSDIFPGSKRILKLGRNGSAPAPGEREIWMKTTDILRRPYARVLIPEADGRFSAEIMEFPGCVAFGDDASSALKALEEVAVDWLDAAVEQGQGLPPPFADTDFSGKLMLRMPKGLHRRAALCAQNEGVSLNAFIAASLAEAVGQRSVAAGWPENRMVRGVETVAASG